MFKIKIVMVYEYGDFIGYMATTIKDGQFELCTPTRMSLESLFTLGVIPFSSDIYRNHEYAYDVIGELENFDYAEFESKYPEYCV